MQLGIIAAESVCISKTEFRFSDSWRTHDGWDSGISMLKSVQQLARNLITILLGQSHGISSCGDRGSGDKASENEEMGGDARTWRAYGFIGHHDLPKPATITIHEIISNLRKTCKGILSILVKQDRGTVFILHFPNCHVVFVQGS
jgi:hypothetical protein